VARPVPAKRILLTALLLLAAALFLALGVWQVERRAWKLDLIASVDRRVHLAARPAPGPADWPTLSAAAEAYAHIRASGTLLNDRETLVQAVTEFGPGYWVVVPLRTEEGWTLLVNRGFVPSDRRDAGTRPGGPVGTVTVTGLLRAPEPGGAFLQTNNPAGDRWFSRDVAAIAAARGLGAVAPYFLDADATPNPGGLPVGGLTIIAFRNSHLIYAITWFVLAVLSGVGIRLTWADRGGTEGT
jgi:surfeit locus 1 family protein